MLDHSVMPQAHQHVRAPEVAVGCFPVSEQILWHVAVPMVESPRYRDVVLKANRTLYPGFSFCGSPPLVLDFDCRLRPCGQATPCLNHALEK
jgi:hypothetical protein